MKKPNIKKDLKKDDLMFIVYILLCCMTYLNRSVGFPNITSIFDTAITKTPWP